MIPKRMTRDVFKDVEEVLAPQIGKFPPRYPLALLFANISHNLGVVARQIVVQYPRYDQSSDAQQRMDEDLYDSAVHLMASVLLLVMYVYENYEAGRKKL